MKSFRKLLAAGLAVSMVFSLAACQSKEETETAAETTAQTTAVTTEAAAEAETEKNEETVSPADHVIVLSSVENADGTYTHSATFDGAEVAQYDYTWNCDLDEDHDEVKNAPAEYHTGTLPEDPGTVYIDHDLYYYPEISEDRFQLVNYDGEQEWAVYYPETSEYKDYIFGTLPAGITMGGGNSASVPTQMMHSAEDALKNAKLHITEPGSYLIQGTWHGQIWIDLGDEDETFTDENAKVTLYLGGTDVTCTVAPALVFASVYECDNTWEDREEYRAEADTSEAGASVVLVDGTVNSFSGSNIFRMLKTKYKDDEDTSEVKVQKKIRKTDAAFYSCRSMNISGGEEGTGVLNVTSSFEGLDSELHLTVNGGNVNIYSQDDGINCNEDGVSVVTFNGGNVHIMAGLGTEGDGVDSNGFLVINGGTVVSMANPASDSGLDSDCGSYVNGGTVLALGSTMDWAEADDSNTAKNATMNLRFSQRQEADEAIIITDTDGIVVFAYDPDKDEIASGNTRYYQGAVISSENFETGKEYLVYVGGDVTGTETAGMYDVSTVTGFTSDAVQQGYSGTDGFGFGAPGGTPPEMPEGETPPAMPENGGSGTERPGAQEGETPPAKPEGDQGGERPGAQEGGNPPAKPEGDQGGKRPEMPEGDQGGERPEMPSDFDPSGMPEGMSMPADFDPSKMTGGFGEGQTAAASELTTLFKLEDSVNNFAGVQDYLP